MSGTMNGAPYYSPPHRHQKSYISRLGTMAEQALKPELAELPALVAAAIRKGLIKRPAPSETIPVPLKGELADWRIAKCEECGITFERGRYELVKCASCRRPVRPCSGCGKDFRPPDRKKVCCSKECSQKKQVANFKASHSLKAKPLGMVQCCICKGMRPEPKRGARIAQTCSKECLLTLRKQMTKKPNENTTLITSEAGLVRPVRGITRHITGSRTRDQTRPCIPARLDARRVPRLGLARGGR